MLGGAVTADLVEIGAHLDVRNVGVVRTTINTSIETATGDVIVDMGALEIIDAAGLGMLTAAHLRAERAGRRLVFRNCSNELRRLLAVTRLNRLLNLDRASQRMGVISA